MANATNPLVGRSVGHEWAVFVATSGQFCWPPMGSSDWPLTVSDRTVWKHVSRSHGWSVFSEKRTKNGKAGPRGFDDHVQRAFIASARDQVW